MYTHISINYRSIRIGCTNMCHEVSSQHLAHVQHLYAYHFFSKYIAYFSKGKAIHPTLCNKKSMVKNDMMWPKKDVSWV